eukprot:c9395_g1_i3.p1 GENE.c9395_g1_i3~~c9395_g1_i3.p1  ORF type:complete len:575 (+),score=96.90 c9395_g1_i3:156-1727(+)
MEEDLPNAEAFCVRGGRFVAVGSEVRVLGACPNARRLNMNDTTITPGLTDSHAHLMEYGLNSMRVDLSPCTTKLCVLDLLANATIPAEGGWLLAQGWDQTQWTDSSDEFPTRQDLDPLFPNTPLSLVRIDGHAIWTNTAAINRVPRLPSNDPEGGKIVRDSNGDPTGIFMDNAMLLISDYIPPPGQDELNRAFKNVLDACRKNGLAGVHDLDALDRDVALFAAWTAAGNSTLRIHAMRHGDTALPTAPQIHTPMLTVQGVKFYMDGALGSWGAALLTNYTDRPDTAGIAFHTVEELINLTLPFVEHGYQICTHAIGDKAVRGALDTYEYLIAQFPSRELRLRVEHAQITDPADVPRFARLGVIPSMQPTHATSDMPFAEQRLGPVRIRGAYAWQSFLAAGVPHLPLGSDFPAVGVVPPLLGIYAAITRQTTDGKPAGGWYPDQCLSPYQSLKGYTRDAAFAVFKEAELGSIAVGKYADFTVLDKDILAVDPREILSTTVLATFVGGDAVWVHPKQSWGQQVMS